MPGDSSYYLQFLHFIFTKENLNEFTKDMYFYHISPEQIDKITSLHSSKSIYRTDVFFIHIIVNRIGNSIKYLQKDTSPC